MSDESRSVESLRSELFRVERYAESAHEKLWDLSPDDDPEIRRQVFGSVAGDLEKIESALDEARKLSDELPSVEDDDGDD